MFKVGQKVYFILIDELAVGTIINIDRTDIIIETHRSEHFRSALYVTRTKRKGIKLLREIHKSRLECALLKAKRLSLK